MSTAEQPRAAFVRDRLSRVADALNTIPTEQVLSFVKFLEDAYLGHRRVVVMGNGGSAATASHMACELGKTVLGDRAHSAARFDVAAITDNAAWLTAIANDLGYQYVFSEQLRNMLREGDLVIAISTSGESENIIEGIRAAKDIGASVIGLLGRDGGRALSMLDGYILVGSHDPGLVENAHLTLNHVITSYLTEFVVASKSCRDT